MQQNKEKKLHIIIIIIRIKYGFSF